MPEPINSPFHKLCIHGVRSLWDTFYWIDEALRRHIQEFKAQPELLAQLAGQAHEPIDLIIRLERLRQDADLFHRDVISARRRLGIEASDQERQTSSHDLPFEELSPQQVADLKQLDEQLHGITQHIQQAAQAIDTALATPLADPSHRLMDRHLETHIRFLLREDDPAYCAYGNNQVAKVKEDCEAPVRQGAVLQEPFYQLGGTWPNGYAGAFPMPHHGLMHQLRLYGGYEMGRVDYRDLLRIGKVNVDIVVTYRYQYDLAEGKWIKGQVWSAHRPRKPAYVQDPSSQAAIHP